MNKATSKKDTEDAPVSAGMPLAEAVATVAAAANAKGGTNPGYRLLRIDVQEGQVHLAAGNGEVWAQAWVDGSAGAELDVRCRSAVCVPAETFHRYVSGVASADRWKLAPAAGANDDDPATVVLSASRHTFRLGTTSPDSFPPPPGEAREPHTDSAAGPEYQGADLRRALRRAGFATDDDVHRYALGGVRIKRTADGLVGFVSTDGRRAVQDVVRPKRSALASPAEFLLPSRAARYVASHLRDDATYRLEFHESFLVVRGGSLSITARGLEGRFPKVEELWPRPGVEMQFTTAAGALRAHVDLALIGAREVDSTSPSVRLELRPDVLRITPRKDDETVVELPAAASGAKDRSVCIQNGAYLVEALAKLAPDDSVEAYFQGPDSALHVEAGDWLYTQMPMSMDEDSPVPAAAPAEAPA